MSLRSEVHEYDVYVFGPRQPLRISFRIFLDRLFISYQFGLYKHRITLDANGLIEEVVLRGDKVLYKEKMYPKIYSNAPPSSEKINHQKLNIVSGAANGFLGIGVTEAERFKNLYFDLDLFKNSKFTVELNQSSEWSLFPLLTIDFDCKMFKIKEHLSDMARHA